MTLEEIKQLNIDERLGRIRAEFPNLSKEGTNSFHKYKYATEQQFVEAAKPLLDKYRVQFYLDLQPASILAIKDSSGETGKLLTTIQGSVRFVSQDDKSQYVSVHVCGQGMDNGDKGIYKAITGAKKYALATVFLVSTGDDAENDTMTFVPKATKSGSKINASSAF